VEIYVAKIHALSGNDFPIALEVLRYHREYVPVLQRYVAPDTTLSVAVRSWTYSRSLGSTSGTLEHPRDLDREVLHSQRYYTIEPTRGSYVLHQPCERYYPGQCIKDCLCVLGSYHGDAFGQNLLPSSGDISSSMSARLQAASQPCSKLPVARYTVSRRDVVHKTLVEFSCGNSHVLLLKKSTDAPKTLRSQRQ